jgi:hypothetical protein
VGPAWRSGGAVWPAAARPQRSWAAHVHQWNRGGRGLTGGPCYSSGRQRLNTIQIQMNSNYFKTFQTLTDPKVAFPSLDFLK